MMLERLVENFDEIEELKSIKRLVIAVSGGSDSLSLTLLANEWGKKNNVKIIGITVNHLLRPSAIDEALYVNGLLKSLNIEHQILNWEGKKPISNIESLAREARYDLIFDFCKKNNINVILLGHHIQDQAENFLIRLFRGSGICGLSSMKKVVKRNGFILIRPFLKVKKEDLKNYLKNNNIKWVEDESNSDEKYLRNKIRNFLDTFDDRDLIVNRINSTMDILQAVDNILDEKVNYLENIVYFYDKDYNYYKIKYDSFLKLDKEIQNRILIKVCKSISENYSDLRFSKLERLLNDIKTSKKHTFYGCIFEKINQDEFVCYKEYNSIKDKDKDKYLKIGELNNYLKFLKEHNYEKYKKINSFRGYKKRLLYTMLIDDFKEQV